LSQKGILKILKSLGLSEIDTKVYIYIEKTGPIKGIDLPLILGMSKQRLYAILKRLEEKNFVTRSPYRPALFTALEFEELLERYVKLNMEQAQIIKETKKELLSNLRDRTDRDNIYSRRL
jgi:sugar-specific transcriptional regulator TrmB